MDPLMAKAAITGVKKRIPGTRSFRTITMPVIKGKAISKMISRDLHPRRKIFLNMVLNYLLGFNVLLFIFNDFLL